MELLFGQAFGNYTSKAKGFTALIFMKRVSGFFKREWFLLVMLVAIMLIVMLFQLF
jgi:hypothetical protein